MLIVLLTLSFCQDRDVIYSALQSQNGLVSSITGDRGFFF